MSPTHPIEIEPAEAQRKLSEERDAYILLDCREHDEVATARIEGARHIPMKEIPERINEIREREDQHVIVHCHAGGRSLKVARLLREQGFDTACSMAGGIDRWSIEVDPSVPRY